jgi:hypothetical protein
MKITCLPTSLFIEFNDEKCPSALWLSLDNSETKTAWLKATPCHARAGIEAQNTITKFLLEPSQKIT